MAEHLYIHLTEVSNLGEGGTGRGFQSGLDLENKFQNTMSQHLQHMPAHIYLRTGHWSKIVEASIYATNSDSVTDFESN